MADRLDLTTESVLAEMWREACDKGTTLRFRVVSGSMSPLIKIGDIVKVCKAEPSDIRIGDIVAFHEDRFVIVHRIIGKTISNSQIQFRQTGDIGGFSKELKFDDIIGRVTAIIKGEREIHFDSRWNRISSKILVSRLRLIDKLGRMRNKHLSSGIRLLLKPIWRLNRRIVFWR